MATPWHLEEHPDLEEQRRTNVCACVHFDRFVCANERYHGSGKEFDPCDCHCHDDHDDEGEDDWA